MNRLYENELITKYVYIKNKTRKIIFYKQDSKLRQQHCNINEFLAKNFTPSIFTKAYTKGVSIYNNAKAHMYNDIFILLDIKDFFPSINHELLVKFLYYEINLLNKNTISKSECASIVENSSIGNKGLPLGLILSPILSNIYMKEFDNRFYGILKKLNLKNVIYTRYADDLSISFKGEYINNHLISVIVSEVSKLLNMYKLKLNEKKTRYRILSISNHVKITGVNITTDENDYRKLSVGRKLKKQLYFDAINCFKCKDKNEYEVARIKGLLSFILSIEKKDFETLYSDAMLNEINKLGYSSLSELIENLK